MLFPAFPTQTLISFKGGSLPLDSNPLGIYVYPLYGTLQSRSRNALGKRRAKALVFNIGVHRCSHIDKSRTANGMPMRPRGAPRIRRMRFGTCLQDRDLPLELCFIQVTLFLIMACYARKENTLPLDFSLEPPRVSERPQGKFLPAKTFRPYLSGF